jgi:PAS domain S-box-containing protein
MEAAPSAAGSSLAGEKPGTSGRLDPGPDEFRELAENLPVLCWMANADGYIFWYNRRWYEYTGTRPADMEGWGWQSVHDPDVLPSVLERWEASIASGERFEMVFPLRGADGQFRPFLTKVEPLRDGRGEVKRWFGSNVEITAQLAAEARVRETAEQLATLAAEREATLRQLHEGVIVTDAAGRITFVNEAAERLHGVAALDVTPDEYTQTYHLFTLDGDPHPYEDLPLYRALTRREQVTGARWIIRRPDGSEVLALGDAGPVYAEDGRQIGAVLTIRDDTERHAAEQKLAEGVRTQELLIAELNHRVKNAFAVVKSIVRQSLARHDMPVEVQKLIDDRLQAYANAHARLMAGHWDRASLHDLADEILGQQVREGRVTLEGGRVMLPARQAIALSMAFYELLTNAFKHGALAAEGGHVRICWSFIEGDAPRLRIEWRESGGPPVAAPRAKGFGTFLIERALAAEMGGQVTMAYDPAGFRWTLDAPFLLADEGTAAA